MLHEAVCGTCLVDRQDNCGNIEVEVEELKLRVEVEN